MIRFLARAFKVLLIVGVCLHNTHIIAQKYDYIATDSSSSIGIKLESRFPRINSQYIIQKYKDKTIKYTPEQLKEYGLKDGTVYETHEILVDDVPRLVFLERLAQGDITLYRYIDTKHEVYYIVKDSSELIELNRDSEDFETLTNDCEFMADALKLATYSKNSIRKLVTYYNVCEHKPFPYPKFGVMAGVSFTKLSKPSGSLASVSPLNSSSPLLGVLLDLPINMSEFSFHQELFFTYNNYSAGSSTASSDTDILIELATLQMPLLVRYTIPTNVWRLFFNTGPLLMYNLKNSSSIYFANIGEDVITINKPIQQNLVDDFMFGYAIGLGIQRNLDFRRTISAEIRYINTLNQGSNTLVQRGMDLVIGFNF